MTVNSALIQALAPMGIPCRPEPYRGKESRFFTFNSASDNGADFGDDMPQHDAIVIYLHYWVATNYNYLNDIKRVRKLLTDADFSYASIVANNVDPDRETIRHIVFSTEFITEV